MDLHPRALCLIAVCLSSMAAGAWGLHCWFAARCPGSSVHDSYRQGNHALEAKDYEQAIRCFSNALLAEPTHYLSFVGRAEALLGQNQSAQAIADCTEAIRLDADRSSAYYCRALAYQQAQQGVEAKRDWRKFEELEARAHPPEQIGDQPVTPVPAETKRRIHGHRRLAAAQP